MVANDPLTYGRLGWSAAIDSGYIVAGARRFSSSPGAVYVFRRSAGQWQQEAKLTAGDEHAWFGSAIDISGDRFFAGARNGDGGLGSAYVFRRAANAWVQEARLVSSNRQDFGFFGIRVAIDRIASWSVSRVRKTGGARPTFFAAREPPSPRKPF